jgi:hypothetical protein
MMLRTNVLHLLVVVALLGLSAAPAMAQPVEEIQLQGIVYHDVDGSGFQEDGEPAIADLEVTLSNGEQNQVLVTDENGQFSAVILAGTWTITLPAESGWTLLDGTSFDFEVTGLEDSVTVSIGLVPAVDEPTPTPEAEETETVEDGTPEATGEALFVDEVEDGVQTPVILPQSGVSLAPSVVWSLGFGLLMAAGVVLIIIGRRGGRK